MGSRLFFYGFVSLQEFTSGWYSLWNSILILCPIQGILSLNQYNAIERRTFRQNAGGPAFWKFSYPMYYLAWKSVLLIEAKYLYRLAFLSLLYFLTDSNASSLKTATWRRCPDGQLFFLPHVQCVREIRRTNSSLQIMLQCWKLDRIMIKVFR